MELKAAGTPWMPMFQVAIEQWMPDEQRIIHDPLAYRFLPAPFRVLATPFRIRPLGQALCNVVDSRWPGIRGGLLCRKRYMDDRLREALAAGAQSVVILGAGLDTRAYRMSELASRQVYEVDLPQNVQSKKQVVERVLGRAPAHVQFVPMDLDRQELAVLMQQAGYAGKQPTFFILEGVTQYISEAAICRIFEFLSQAPVQSWLVFSYVRKDFIEGRNLYGLDSLYDEVCRRSQLWQFGLEPEVVGAFLGQYRWRVLEDVGSAEYEARYLRPARRAMPLMEIERVAYALARADGNALPRATNRGRRSVAARWWVDRWSDALAGSP